MRAIIEIFDDDGTTIEQMIIERGSSHRSEWQTLYDQIDPHRIAVGWFFEWTIRDVGRVEPS